MKAHQKVLLLALLAVSLCPAGAGIAATSDLEAKVPAPRRSDELSEYRGTFGASPEEAEDSLRLQDQAAGVVPVLSEVLGSSYSGVWFDNGSGKFIVPLIHPSSGEDVAEVFDSMGIGRAGFRTQPASSSWEDLEHEQGTLNQKLHAALLAGELQSSIDPRANAVKVFVAAGAEASTRDKVAGLAEASTVVSQSLTHGLEPKSTQCVFGSCSRPGRGGVDIEKQSTGGTCSAGFKAIGNTFGNRFILTAGHCTKGRLNMVTNDPDFAGTKQIGTVEETFTDASGYDVGKINANGYWWDTNPWPTEVVYWTHGEPYEAINPHVSITSEAPSYLGEWACHSGTSSGTSCGSVTKVDLAYDYDTVEGHQVRTDMSFLTGPELCIEGGDSGGPVFAGNTALGITGAEESELPRPCGNGDYYSEITTDSDLLGVHVASRAGSPPVVWTESGSIGGVHQAQMFGGLDPNGLQSTYTFQYGTSQAYGSGTGVQSVGAGFQKVGVSGSAQNLKGSTTYHYRLIGNNLSGTSDGEDRTFTTPDWRPAISYQPATGRTTSSATLNAKINPQGEATTYHFEWGETTSYGNSGPVPDASIGSGTSDVAVSRALSGLKPETTYHFRVVAKNGEGTKIGPDATVTTMANTPAYASSFGAGGAGDGQFSRPLAMAADAPGGFPSGDVWVVDKLNNRVEKFNSKGQFVSKFGSFGTGNGQFNEPRAITVDGQGNLWVADAGNNRIQQFNSKGEYLGQIKSGLVLKSIDIPSGLAIGRENHIFVANQGSGGTIFELLAVPTGGPYVTAYWDTTTTPANMATDPQGDVWVVDTAENKLYEVPSSGGGPVARFGTTGTAPGQLSAPYAVAVKPSGTLLVSDRGNNRIQQFSQTGELLASFGKGGNEPGEFCEPSGLALSSRGVVFVADACHDKVQRWNQKTAPEAITQPATSVAATSATLNARINPSGLATSYHFDYGKTTAYGTWAPASSGVLGASFEDATVTATITGLVPDTIYHRRIAAMNAEGTTFGKDHTFVTPSGTAAYASSFSSLGPEGGSLNRPLGMAAEVIGGVATGNLWIVDNKNNRVVKVNSEGGYIRHVGSFGTANGQFDSPRGVAVDDQGNIWVTDAGNHRVQKFNAKGEFLMRIRSLDVDGSSALETPSGIAIGREGHLFVGDQGLGGVILELSTTQGSNGRYAAWQYTNATNPTQLATDEDGDVWVIDYQDNKVYEVPESGGAPVVRFGTGGTGPGQLTGPYGIAVKPNGNILISNRGNNLIQQFSPWGAYQFQFGAPGTGPGQFSEPSQMVVGPDGSVYVADSGNNRVQRWTFK